MNIYKIFSFALVITLMGIPLKAGQSSSTLQNGEKIHSAAKSGELDVVKKIVEQCPDMVNALNLQCNTPLHLASGNGHFEVVKYLIEKGASINLKNGNGETPLHYAAYTGQFKITQYLIQHKAIVDARRLDNKTPLHLAVYQGKQETVGTEKYQEFVSVADFFVVAGADINAIDTEFKDSILHAAVGDNPFWAQFFVEVGADIYSKNAAGRTPLQEAVHKRFLYTSTYLMNVQNYYEKGDVIPKQDRKSCLTDPNYLILAAIKGDLRNVNSFFDPNDLDIVDNIPLHVEYMRLPYYEIVNYSEKWSAYFRPENPFSQDAFDIFKKKSNDWGIRQLIWLYLTHKPDKQEQISKEDSFKEIYVESPIEGKPKNKLWLHVLMQYNLYKKESKLFNMSFRFEANN